MGMTWSRLIERALARQLDDVDGGYVLDDVPHWALRSIPGDDGDVVGAVVRDTEWGTGWTPWGGNPCNRTEWLGVQRWAIRLKSNDGAISLRGAISPISH